MIDRGIADQHPAFSVSSVSLWCALHIIFLALCAGMCLWYDGRGVWKRQYGRFVEE